MSNATLGAGNVAITINGEAMTLRPNLKAAQTISRQAGGILGAIQSVGKFELDVIVNVIALGTGTPPKDAEPLAEKVYQNGLSDLVAPVTEYLAVLANGGRPVSEEQKPADPQ